MRSFEIWITDDAGSTHVRVEIVTARSYRAAYFAGQQLCKGTEFVRGCVEL
jgi:hypothetical protein